MAGKNKLELTWIGKDKRPRLEPRILLENPTYSYHAATRKEGDLFDNVLIKGDNLLALKALEQNYAGKVKCVFIDPPYNTGSAFTHYDDGIEHSLWLGLIRERLEILKNLLSSDGSIWITIDDNEAHYLKVLCDEVFGRDKFIANIVWQKRYAPDSRLSISDAHEHIICYALNPSEFKETRNLIPLEEAQTKQFKNPDGDPRGPWKADNFTAPGFRKNQMYEITLPSGRVVTPPAGRCWRVTKDGFDAFTQNDQMYYGPNGDGAPSVKRFLAEMAGMAPWTWWPHTEAGHYQEAKRESQILFGGDNTFDTPKPERLLRRILHIATNPGDLVLDSFAGSGTTGAVAHKMGRRWIMVELGDHCETHVVPRLKKVIDGEDQGGISKAVEWKGGGGYRYFKLAPSLLEKDDFGQWVFSKAYNPQMLIEALCKHFNFTYAPSAEVYWQHGHNSATDFIFCSTTSQSLEQLKALSDAVGPDRTLLICCTAFESAHADAFTNLTLRKIPNAILNSCEWGHDDYSLKIANLPIAEEEEWEFDDEPEPAPAKTRKKAKAEADSGDLFGEEQ